MQKGCGGSHGTAPEPHCGDAPAASQVCDDRTGIVLLVVSQRDGLAFGLATASEVKSEHRTAELQNDRQLLQSLEATGRVPVQVDDARQLFSHALALQRLPPATGKGQSTTIPHLQVLSNVAPVTKAELWRAKLRHGVLRAGRPHDSSDQILVALRQCSQWIHTSPSPAPRARGSSLRRSGLGSAPRASTTGRRYGLLQLWGLFRALGISRATFVQQVLSVRLPPRVPGKP
mmetsp:Transcript_2527/g.5820  ORF Transcript_2527/g.5820 Transcript_2527/m.5820 type:complete len:231 (+) Transcript_2527:919-1611(+)